MRLRAALMLTAAAAAVVFSSGCATDRYVCFPPSTCRRAEAAYKSLGHIECLTDQMKDLVEREKKLTPTRTKRP